MYERDLFLWCQLYFFYRIDGLLLIWSSSYQEFHPDSDFLRFFPDFSQIFRSYLLQIILKYDMTIYRIFPVFSSNLHVPSVLTMFLNKVSGLLPKYVMVIVFSRTLSGIRIFSWIFSEFIEILHSEFEIKVYSAHEVGL